MRPIDGDALVERICGEHCGCHRSQCGYSMLDDGYDACSRVAEIEAAPTLDVQPVRRGKWRYVNYQTDKTTWITGEFICRKCGKCIPRHMGDNPPDYCQHCGADMRGVSHGTD